MREPDLVEPDIETRLRSFFASRRRAAARLVLRGDRKPGEHDSKLGGLPFLPAGEAWPTCATCHRPFTFIGQIRLDHEGLWRPDEADLLTFFYCWRCLPWEEPNGHGYLLRLHHRIDLEPAEERPEDALGDLSPEPCLLEADPFTDVPALDDAAADPLFRELFMASEEVEPHFGRVREQLLEHRGLQSQLAGWPRYLQQPIRPARCACGAPMRFLALLDSEEQAGLHWGNEGCVYIYCCEEPCSTESLTLYLQSA